MSLIKFMIEDDTEIYTVEMSVSSEFVNDKSALRETIKSYLGKRFDKAKKIVSVNNDRGVIYYLLKEQEKPKIKLPSELFRI